ncbi:MAG: hypothetical protein HOM11_13260 [Methylococcales bacterium]|nr:hypothetical protein [Methylococcales bacterium]MBT7444030.1 hypothetical protein [Methylococcales bacterium]
MFGVPRAALSFNNDIIRESRTLNEKLDRFYGQWRLAVSRYRNNTDLTDENSQAFNQRLIVAAREVEGLRKEILEAKKQLLAMFFDADRAFEKCLGIPEAEAQSVAPGQFGVIDFEQLKQEQKTDKRITLLNDIPGIPIPSGLNKPLEELAPALFVPINIAVNLAEPKRFQLFRDGPGFEENGKGLEEARLVAAAADKKIAALRPAIRLAETVKLIGLELNPITGLPLFVGSSISKGISDANETGAGRGQALLNISQNIVKGLTVDAVLGVVDAVDRGGELLNTNLNEFSSASEFIGTTIDAGTTAITSDLIGAVGEMAGINMIDTSVEATLVQEIDKIAATLGTSADFKGVTIADIQKTTEQLKQDAAIINAAADRFSATLDAVDSTVIIAVTATGVKAGIKGLKKKLDQRKQKIKDDGLRDFDQLTKEIDKQLAQVSKKPEPAAGTPRENFQVEQNFGGIEVGQFINNGKAKQVKRMHNYH